VLASTGAEVAMLAVVGISGEMRGVAGYWVQLLGVVGRREIQLVWVLRCGGGERRWAAGRFISWAGASVWWEGSDATMGDGAVRNLDPLCRPMREGARLPVSLPALLSLHGAQSAFVSWTTVKES
jgi:hypothetical protein